MHDQNQSIPNQTKIFIFQIHIPIEREVPYPVKVPFDKPVPIELERHVPISVEKPFKYTAKKYLPISNDKDDHRGSNSEKNEQRVEGAGDLSAGYSTVQSNETNKKTEPSPPTN